MTYIDDTRFGLYMQILRERAARRAKRGDRAGQGRAGNDDKVVYLRRGTIDEVLG